MYVLLLNSPREPQGLGGGDEERDGVAWCPQMQDDEFGQSGRRDGFRCDQAGYYYRETEGGRVRERRRHGWSTAALLEDMKDTKRGASFRNAEVDMHQAT